MNIEEFRKIYMSLKGVTEKMPWSDDPKYSGVIVFSVGGKWFGFVDVDEFEFCNLKCDPELSLELQDRYSGVVPGWHMNKKHWISVYFNRDVPDAKIRELVIAAHELVFKSLPKKLQAKINAAQEQPY